MDTVTYPDKRVEEMVVGMFIPVRVKVKENRDLVTRYGVRWTPHTAVLDEGGVAHYVIEGYRPPEDFMGRLALALGRWWFDRGAFDKAMERWEEAARRHPGSEVGAEGLYWTGVAHYKRTGEPARLFDHWKELLKSYPRSEWARSADFPKKRV